MVNEILQEQSQKLIDKYPASGTDLIPHLNSISTNIPQLDNILCGGILTSSITEIYGQAGSGKTQFALQISVQTLLPLHLAGLDSGVVYISTEGRFPMQRFIQILTEKTSEIPDFDVKRFTDRLYILHTNDTVTQSHVIKYHLPALLTRVNVKLIVIDSIAANYRGEVADRDRNKEVYEIGRMLKRIAAENNIAVLCVNQVTGVIDSISSDEDYKPALGNTWSRMVNTRLHIKRKNLFGDSKERIIRVSSMESPNECLVDITTSGLVETN